MMAHLSQPLSTTAYTQTYSSIDLNGNPLSITAINQMAYYLTNTGFTPNTFIIPEEFYERHILGRFEEKEIDPQLDVQKILADYDKKHKEVSIDHPADNGRYYYAYSNVYGI